MKTRSQKTLNDMPKVCPCGGGQSCLVDRRWLGEWCHEDDVFKKANIPLRTSCIHAYSLEQAMALKQSLKQPIQKQ